MFLIPCSVNFKAKYRFAFSYLLSDLGYQFELFRVCLLDCAIWLRDRQTQYRTSKKAERTKVLSFGSSAIFCIKTRRFPPYFQQVRLYR